MTVDLTDAADWRRSAGATGLLRIFNDAGAIETADVLVAQRLTALGNEPDERVALAIAFVVRAVRGGSVCVQLTAVPAQVEIDDLPWPEPAEWRAAVAASPLLSSPAVLHLEEDLLYFDRYWLEERQVAADVLALAAGRPHGQLPDIARLFPKRFEEQRAAAEIALSRGLTVLTGGPGTGKTTTVARLLALLAEQAELAGKPQPRIALAAPTGKAAARLQEAVQAEVNELALADQARLRELGASTLHRLLGRKRDSSSRFRYHRANRLPHDVIVVDETSMVSLTMMARLVESVRPDSRLLLVGDPDQLASVEAGAVLADLVEGLSAHVDTPVAKLLTAHRFGPSIGALASAIRVGDANRALDVLNAGGEHIEWLDTEDPADALRSVLVPHALRLREAAVLGDGPAALATLEEHRLLCAHRQDVSYWNRQVERWLAEETDAPLWASWYAGRPVLVTVNDYGLRLYNGDIGVAVLRDGVLRAVMAGADGQTELATGRLADIETMHAMTIHKSQGSQVGEVTVLLPQTDSRLLTRELLYTAVTRARTKVRVVGSAEQLRAAVARRAARASGLARRLQG
ncbi:exodeoxyribonuclease V alpha subunit [Mycolicibacterium sp. BK556]|uniref:exodeoxyribonuclease V subunit alpha n=1 Tax=unclassified Mycolicibacterium TaxID=2636767 RepID=UPI00160B56F9|nr:MULTISPECIES: exodeoxyribonuclease V subunit alpha [unclassified Mycolicibacterium]MBB3600918.1 exodeoxyribonuclease V alpha subunit [Mycolicibacterium sp. BK556]MBB3630672.1 exodeoxyribonuclease V alpha subunit [Mycolicibacterium sp. BK607]MBB3748666.1 exodeoxyribonuclease V alpha subunit [Mycolicibacterium sp. BK634]